MSRNMSINDYVNILEYNHLEVPNSIYHIKKKASYVMNKKMCVIYHKGKRYDNMRKLFGKIKLRSKNKRYGNRTQRKMYNVRLIGHSTRNISPLSYLFFQEF